MEEYSYRAFQPNSPIEAHQATLAEGRRLAALTLAVKCGPDTDDGLIATAARFEAYLKGEAVEDVNGAPLVPIEPEPWEANVGPEDRGAL